MNGMPKCATQSDESRFGRPRSWITLAFVLLLTACATKTPAPLSSQAYRDASTEISVASNGWHSSIILAKADLPPDRLAETADFPDARYLEFGWGDADYYPAEQATLGVTLSAALVPTPAVVHVAGLSAEPARSYPRAEIVSLPVNDENFRRLIEFLDASFDRSGATRIRASEPGLYATSLFYPATGRFHLFNTCNSWTARALMAAGFDVKASGTYRAEALMRQVRALVNLR